MTTVAPTPDQSSDSLKKLSLDSQQKPVELSESTKKPSSVQYDAGEAGKVSNATIDRSTTPMLQEFMDPNVCYVPHGYSSYYYGGYDGSMSEWEDYSRYVSPDGVEMPAHRVYGDNGSMMYHPGYGYPPYGAYPPDGQLYGPQTYQYPPPYYQPPNTSNGQYNSNNQVPASQSEVSTTVSPDQGGLPTETTSNGNTNGVANGIHKAPSSTPSKQPSTMVNSNGSYGRGILPGGRPTSCYQDPRFGFEGMHGSTWTDGPVLSDGQYISATSGPLSSSGTHTVAGARNQNLHPLPHVMGIHPSRPASGMAPAPGYMNRTHSNNRVYNHGAGAFRIPPTYGSNCYDFRANGRGWMPVDGKFKPRGRGNGYFFYGNENMDVLNEQNKGPRAARIKNQRAFPSGVTLAVKGQNITLNGKSDESTPDRDQYNRSEFDTKYADAKFFVIKSYSEDDVHKSIKYNVWASTPNGNKKLDAAYQDAREKTDACPVFLLFSVNTSGQFCGLAEMVGPVDFNKNLDYWQQDKWNGCFPVKWHIVKDIPNSLLKHIALENNDNKPVTNSRDTQEVNFDKGLEILKIFKEYVCKTSILDDFGFYEARQRQMQESRAKTQQLKKIQKQMWDGQVTEASSGDKEGTKSKPQKATTESAASTLQKEQSQAVGERKPVEENGSVAGSGDPKGAKPATEKRVPNGIANGC